MRLEEGARNGCVQSQHKQNKAPFVVGPQLVPTEGLGEAPADLCGCWGARRGHSPMLALEVAW